MTQAEFEAWFREHRAELDYSHPLESAAKFGFTADEWTEHITAHNRAIDEEWLVDYAKRLKRPIEDVRNEVYEQRRRTAEYGTNVSRRMDGLPPIKCGYSREMVSAYVIEEKGTTMAKTTKQTIEQPAIVGFGAFTAEQEQEIVKAEKENKTMTKNAAEIINAIAAATEPKEEVVTEKPAKYNYKNAKAAAEEFRAKYIDEIAAAEPLPGVTSCLPGKGIANLTDDPAEQVLLAKFAAKFDLGTGFCTVSQAQKFGGTLNADEQGWLVYWAPKTPKTGKNAGVTTQWSTVVYPVNAFTWANGEPTFDAELDAARTARRALAKERREIKKAKELLREQGMVVKTKGTTPKKRTTKKAPKPVAPEVQALNERLAAMEKQMAETAAINAKITAILAKLA